MPSLDRTRFDGRFVGFVTVNSAGAWSDVTLGDWTSVTADSIPEEGTRVISLSVRETSGANPCYLLFRANDGEATSAAFQIAAGSAELYDCYLVNSEITTISVYGQAHVKAFFL